MNEELERSISHIEGLTDLHLSLLMEMLKADGGKMFPLDMLASAAVKRSMSLCSGFASLMRDKNYTCAASLLRLQLDSCLRFFAAFIVENPHDFAYAVFKGTPIRKMKDRNGHLMTDRYLVDSLGKKYEWMPRVYDATSGFIHLSERHIFTAFQAKEGERNVGLTVGAKDDDIPIELWIELAHGFLAATDALVEYLKGWTFTKQNPDAVKKYVDEQRR
ncbi:MAG: hypothetical protein IPM20_02585 [Gammaproteobacteria bacterium]|nr:hypothetical protein [Gammaproteobacteria bacterium]